MRGVAGGETHRRAYVPEHGGAGEVERAGI